MYSLQCFDAVVGGDDVTGALHVLQLHLSPPPPSSLALIKPANPGSPGKWPLYRQTDRQTDRDVNPYLYPLCWMSSPCQFGRLMESYMPLHRARMND